MKIENEVMRTCTGTYLESCQQINDSPVANVGAGVGINLDYPEICNVYSYECYAGNAISESWVFARECRFSRLMAYAGAIRWDGDTTLFG